MKLTQLLILSWLAAARHSRVLGTAHSVTSDRKLTLPLFLYLPLRSLPLSLSLSSAHWFKYTKVRPDRQCHNWLPVQCVSARCSVTQNTLKKEKKIINMTFLNPASASIVLNLTAFVCGAIVKASTFTLPARAQTPSPAAWKLSDMPLSQQLWGLHHAVLPKPSAKSVSALFTTWTFEHFTT